MNKILLSISFLFLVLGPMAQAQDAGGAGQNEDILQESMRDIITVTAVGASGAILGLSTLSFVEEPKDHLKNIVVGGAIGIIIGVGIVAWQQATKSQDLYQNAQLDVSPKFNTNERLTWHNATQKSLKTSNQLSQVGYSFTF